jgi:hypothetical protein
LDTDGIIRSKGRLQNATMSDSAKVLFPKNTTNAIIILTSVHETIFHCGVESTLARLI